MKPEDHIIVIGRQYGSGGRKLGQTLSARLGLPYYDKELLQQAAKTMGFRTDLFEKADEKRGSRFFSMLGANYGASTYFTSGAIHSGTLYQMQSDVIRSIMEKGSCIIVGRTADYIGRDLNNLVSLFLYADKATRVERTFSRGVQGLSDRDDISLWLDKQDSVRSDYYNYYTGRKWGDAGNYDLCINTTHLNPEQTADLVELFIKHKNS